MGSALLLLPEAVCLTPASCPELFQEVSAKFKEIIREAEKSNYLADAWVSSAVIQIVLLLVRHNFEHTPRFTDVSFPPAENTWKNSQRSVSISIPHFGKI